MYYYDKGQQPNKALDISTKQGETDFASSRIRMLESRASFALVVAHWMYQVQSCS